MDIYWRDAVQCPSEEEYKTMVIRSRFPWVHPKAFFMLNSTENDFQMLLKTKVLKNKDFFLDLILSDVVFILVIYVKMPTVVGILTFMSNINFMLN